MVVLNAIANFTRMIKMVQKVREQEIRFWDERTFWHEIILKV